MLAESSLYNEDELDDLFPEEILAKSEAMKKSPGHMSVASVDSGFGYASPNRSLPDLDSHVLSLHDLIEEDEDHCHGNLLAEFMASTATYQDLLGLAVGGEPSLSTENQVMETSGETSNMDELSVGDVNEVFSIPETTDMEEKDDDLSLLLDAVSSNSPVSEPTSESVNTVQHMPTTRSQRPVRATRSGKTLVVSSSEEKSKPSPSPGPSTKRVTRSKTGTRRPPKQSASELENLNIEEVDPSSKNALQARLNRQKKKAYIQGLEEQVEALAKENESLKKDNKKYLTERDSLEEEVKYYKSVLANDSQLAGLLKNIGNVQNVRLTTSFETSRKRGMDLDHDYGVGSASKRRRTTHTEVKMSGGVCLHVDKDNVSLEFCSKCSKMASGAGREAQS